MRINNIHYRDYTLSTQTLATLLDSLSSPDDLLWPYEKWLPMVLDQGLQQKSKGGHGPIGYCVEEYQYGSHVIFNFTAPKEFVGIHRFDLISIQEGLTRLQHTISMEVNLKGLLSWFLVVKWLHDALLEDCLDKVYNQHHNDNVCRTPHTLWVKILRRLLGRKKQV